MRPPALPSSSSGSPALALRETILWTVKERDPRTGLYLPRARGKNLHTNFGLTAFAGGFQGSYAAPVYMVVDSFAPTLVSLSGTTLTLNATQQPTITGDSQLVLSVGTGTQEVVSFAGTPGGTPPNYVYTLTAVPSLTHTVGDVCVRQVTASDSMTSVLGEVAYDSVNAPGMRAQSIGGYSSGTGNWVMQFFFTATQAMVNFVTVGLADAAGMGAGNLHNHLVLGYAHTGTTTDLEVDVSLTLANA